MTPDDIRELKSLITRTCITPTNLAEATNNMLSVRSLKRYLLRETPPKARLQCVVLRDMLIGLRYAVVTHTTLDVPISAFTGGTAERHHLRKLAIEANIKESINGAKRFLGAGS